MVEHQPVSRRRVTWIACVGVAMATLLSPFAAQAASGDDVLTYRGPDRQQRLEAGAKKEGKLTVYSTLIVNQALQPLVEALVKKYPYIKTEYSRADAAKMVAKVLAEQRANALVGDVMETGGATVPLLKANALLPFYS